MVTGVNHSNIDVTDVELSKDFYIKLFGFKLQKTYNYESGIIVCLLTLHDFVLELVQLVTPRVEKYSIGVRHHLAFDVDNLRQTIKDFKENGVEFQSEEIKFGYAGTIEMINLKGPDGENIALIETL
jgi:catechol 2,3-dioxygenase-like lactoylglutathione lyase family enzyme